MRELVAKITCGSVRGTGFVVGRGKLATALHVVADRHASPVEFRDSPVLLEFVRLGRDERWQSVEVSAAVIVGAWDRDQDYALLQFDPQAKGLWDLPIAELSRLPEEAVSGRDLRWSTWGFPDAFPVHGMELGGRVSTTLGALDALDQPSASSAAAVRALQLFSAQAAAAQGTPVAGLSGAPVFVDGKVVGLLRFALLQPRVPGEEPRSQAGTLYACPIEDLRDSTGPLCQEELGTLPPLTADESLPEEPFRYLERYERRDARVFFGRGVEIRAVLSRFTRTDVPPILLLYGPMGAGKSSFLRAGLQPRMPDTALHIRARAAEGLLETWSLLEDLVVRAAGIPVLDQLEEAWSKTGKGDAEIDALLNRVTAWLAPGFPRKGICITLSFREEKLSDVEDALRAHGMRWESFFLKPLARPGLLETMAGFERDELIRDFYRISFEEGLPERIVDAILTGSDSAVAPVLQVLLTRLWEVARARRTPDRQITKSDFTAQKESGLGLGDFLQRQLKEVEASTPEMVQSGLALEVLAAYTSPAATAKRLALDEMTRLFDPSLASGLTNLVRALVDARLLLPDGERAHRLVHDALAPLVQQAAAESGLPGQRARRILTQRAVDWGDGKTGQVLSEVDLAIVVAGETAMRVKTPGERRLVEASRQDMLRRARVRRALGWAAGAAIAAIIGLGVLALLQSHKSAAAAHALAQRLALNWFRSGHTSFENDHDVLKAFLSVAQALSVAPDDDPNRASYFARLLPLAPSTPQIVMNLGRLARGTIDPEHSLVVFQRDEGSLEAWNTQSRARLPLPLAHLVISGGLPFLDPPAIREDGRYAAIVTPGLDPVGDLRLIVWEPGSGRVILNEKTDVTSSPTFGPLGWLAHHELEGYRLWNLESATHPFPGYLPAASSLAPSGIARPLVAVYDGGFRFMDLADESKSAGPFLQGLDSAWFEWVRDGRLLVVSQRGSTFQGHWCTPAGCIASFNFFFKSPPDSGLTIDSCGIIFGSKFFLRENGVPTPLPVWPPLRRLCRIGDTLSGWTSTGIVECAVGKASCQDADRTERSTPGGFIAAEWTRDRQHLMTLSANGTLLRWPAVVPPSNRSLLTTNLTHSDDFAVRSAFSRDGRVVAVALADHTGIDIQILRDSKRRSITIARVEFPDDPSLPAELKNHDNDTIWAQTRVMRFSDDASLLLVGFQSRQAELVVLDSTTGRVIGAPRLISGDLDDGMIVENGISVLLRDRSVTRIPLRSGDGEASGKRCNLPSAYRFNGFGRHGELLMGRSDRFEVWSSTSCKAIGSLSATGHDWGIISLANVLLRQADLIRSEDRKLVARFGEHEIVITTDEIGMLSMSRDASRLYLPSSPVGRDYLVAAVSPDGRRAAVVEEPHDKARRVDVWDLEIGLPMALMKLPEVEIPAWSSFLASYSNWGIGFTSNGDELTLVSRIGEMTLLPLGPAQLPEASWMKELDIGLTGLRIREDGSLYSPPDAFERMAAFRPWLRRAWKSGDRAAGALLDALGAK